MARDEIRIRFAQAADLEAMYDIYRPYVLETAVSFDVEEPGLAAFSRRIEALSQRYPCLVAAKGDRIIGYAYANTFNARPAYNWSAEATIYLNRDCRRQGAGRKLYAALEEMLRAQGICNLEACIGAPRAENDPHLTWDSIRFHTRMGFRMVGQFNCCGSKFGRWYDMAWMEKQLSEHLPNPAPVKWFPQIRAQFSSFEG